MAKLIGLMRVGRDAEVKTLPGGEKVANLSLAYNYGRADAEGKRPTQWVDAALWGKRAEALEPYLKKGTMHEFTVHDIHMEPYTDKEGFQAFKMTGNVIDVELGPKQAPSQGNQSQGQAPAARRPADQQSKPRPANQSQSTGTGFDDMDDDLDIPF